MRWPDDVVDQARTLKAQGMRYAEISASLGVPINTLWGWLSRGQRRIITEAQQTLIMTLRQDPAKVLEVLKDSEKPLAEAVISDMTITENAIKETVLTLLKEKIQ